MKSRPSFGLLVVSWYLLTPPFVGGNPDIEATGFGAGARDQDDRQWIAKFAS